MSNACKACEEHPDGYCGGPHDTLLMSGARGPLFAAAAAGMAGPSSSRYDVAPGGGPLHAAGVFPLPELPHPKAPVGVSEDPQPTVADFLRQLKLLDDERAFMSRGVLRVALREAADRRIQVQLDLLARPRIGELLARRLVTAARAAAAAWRGFKP